MTATSAFDALAYRDTIEEMSSTHLAQLDAEAGRLQVQLNTINEQRRLIRGVLRTINPPEPKPATPKKPSKTNSNIGRAKVQSVREFLLAHADAEVTTRYVMDALDINKDTAGAALKVLRDEGFLRLAGRSSGQGAPLLYRVIDEGHVEVSLNGR